MDGAPLGSASELIDLPELKAEAEAWALKRASEAQELDRVQRSVIVRDLVDQEQGLPPEVRAFT